jgi:hypothetical protein
MIAAPEYAYAPEVVWAGGRWAVFYTADHDDDGVHLLGLAEDGTPMGAPILVARDGERPGAAWNGTSLALAYTDPDTYCCANDPTTGVCTSNCTDHALELSILAPDGTRTLDGRQLNDDIDTLQKPIVIWGDGGITLAYCDGRPYVHRLAADGSDRESRADFLDGSECPFGLILDGSRYAGIANDGGDLRFAESMFDLWADTTPLLARPGDGDPDTIRLVQTSAGLVVAFTENETLTVGSIDPSVPALASMAVVATDLDRSGDADMASRGDGALLVWTADTATGEEDITFLALDAAGNSTEPAAPLHVSPVRSDDPDVAWSGTRFGVAWIEDGETVWFTTVACQ